ncbi:MAG: 4-(cytidine 5'-diphospho)-2-C-methyl-D-erythritol kinase [Candidatus Omnitrophica bacterium]|nr:4-(cytidine 5'-diphospho)-2-C-methyl-D-erythritol kinase [Candidatus Omnitrophota bacterium]
MLFALCAMRTLILKSPSKLNLYLKIIRRRSNGYHELVTLFHRISLCDTLRIQKKPKEFFLRCSDPRLSCGEDNLITRAYRELQNIFPKLGGVSVNLTKRIPMGGGLGGGSGNAASFLLGMKKLYSLPVSRMQLVQIAVRLGADVAFFIYDTSTAIGRGVGEKLKLVPNKIKHWFVLVISREELSTKQVYQALPRKLPAVSLTKVSRVVTMISNFFSRKNSHQISQLFANDLEAPAFQLRPSIRQTLLRFHPLGVTFSGMSGSGPTVFAMVPSLSKAREVARKIRKQEPDKQVLICHSW